MAPSLFLSPRNLEFPSPTISKGRQAVRCGGHVWFRLSAELEKGTLSMRTVI